MPLSRPEGPGILAEVLWVDRFGNAQLNLGADDIAGWGDRIRLRIGETVRSAVVVDAFGTLGPGQIGLVIDSYGLLAVCLDRRSAAEELGLGPAEPVVLEPIPDDEGVQLRLCPGGVPSAPVACPPMRPATTLALILLLAAILIAGGLQLVLSL